MPITMSRAALPLFNQLLDALARVLEKAEAHAAARKIDPSALSGARLYPDMFPLTRQVQTACDFAKGTVARLAGLPGAGLRGQRNVLRRIAGADRQDARFHRIGGCPADRRLRNARHLADPRRQARCPQRRTLSHRLRHSEHAFPRDGGLRHPASQRRGTRQGGFLGSFTGVVTPSA